MKIKFLLLITIILFSSVYAHGGSHDHKRAKPEGCIIYGTVLDSINSQPIEYVSISVINNNKDIETGGITNSKGVFEIKGIKPGTYSVRIEFMGFSIIEFRDIKLAFSGAIWKK
ncbi:uncharacterized protein METZ01_LOCUS425681, partial [marine metagenome]